MTEAEWLQSDDPVTMLRLVGTPSSAQGNPPFVSDRKLRLFACACVRQVWHLLTDERSRKAVEVAERYADGDFRSSQEARDALIPASRDWISGTINSPTPDLSKMCPCHPLASVAAYHAVHDQNIPNAANLLRDIFGNPFRPVTLPLGPLDYFMKPPSWHKGPTHGQGYYPTQCPWLTPTVVSLSPAAYEERPGRESGEVVVGHRCAGCGVRKWGKCRCTVADGSLCPDRLAILADALEDAGCEDEEVLRHLRGQERCWMCVRTNSDPLKDACSVCGQLGRVGPFGRPCAPGWVSLRGPHVRGCHVLDLLLGKE
jgi:hypothetical protein